MFRGSVIMLKEKTIKSTPLGGRERERQREKNDARKLVLLTKWRNDGRSNTALVVFARKKMSARVVATTVPYSKAFYV